MFFSTDLVQSLPFFNQLLIIVINAVGFSLIVTFLNHNPLRSPLTLVFLGLSLSIFGWVDFAYLARLAGPNQIEAAEFFLRIAWFATPFVFMFAYIMSTLIVGASQKFRITTILVVLISVVLGIVTGITDFTVDGINFVNQNVDIQYGAGFLPFLGIIGIIMAATVWPILSVHEANTDEQQGVRVFFLGVIIFYVANLIFNITLPFFFQVTHLYYFGDYSTMVLLSSIVYAILRHKFFNVKYIATELFIFAFWMFIFLRTLVITNFYDQLVSVGLLIVSIILGIFLMRSVLREVKIREALAVANAQQTNLIRFISHEVKGALGKSRGFSSLIGDGSFGEVAPKLKEMSADVFKTTTKGVEMVEDILNASNIRKGTFSYEKKVFDFKNMVTTIAEGFRATAEGKGLTFVIHVPEGDWQFTGDEKQLSHVIKNLVDNSVRYTTTGSVTVDLEKSPDSIRFKVTDTGFGLSDDDKKNLFTEGGKGKESQKVNVESTGYGLYIVKGIVEAHGGKVWADSPGRSHGSSFIVELPIVAAPAPTAPLANVPVTVANPAPLPPDPEQKV